MASRHTRREVERFKECKYCGGQNTKEVVCSDLASTTTYFYFGWCFDCRDGYEYSMQVDNVRDRKGRI